MKNSLVKHLHIAIMNLMYYCFTVTSTEGLQQHVLQP